MDQVWIEHTKGMDRVWGVYQFRLDIVLLFYVQREKINKQKM